MKAWLDNLLERLGYVPMARHSRLTARAVLLANQLQVTSRELLDLRARVRRREVVEAALYDAFAHGLGTNDGQ